MADAQQPQATGGQARDFAIPDSVRAQFADLIELIAKSESMNDDERQYWFDILPVMTPEQVQNLRQILTNERDQLADIDAKFAQQAAAGANDQEMAEKRRTSREQLQTQEQQDQSQEEHSEQDLLNKISEL